MPNALSKLAQEMTHYGTGRIPTQDEVNNAIDVGIGRKPRDIVYGEQGLQAPSVAGGMVSLDPTDYLGPGELKALLGIAGKGLPMAMAGIMAGKGAKTANLVMLDKAQEMAKAGIPHEQIWKETGWALDTPDKLPRFEIPDTKLFYRGSGPANSSYASDVVMHPELYDAYPSAGNIRVIESAEAGGKYNPDLRESITVGGNNKSSTALHELQHAIQQREGFARGGSPEMFKGESSLGIPEIDRRMQDFLLINEAVKQGKNPVDVAKLTNPELVPFIKNIQKNNDWDYVVRQANEHFLTPEQKYQRLGGEAEARLVESRMNMTPEERLAQYPYDPAYFEKATGVPLNSLIVMKDRGPAMSVPNKSMADLISEAQAQIDAENAARNMLHYQPENNRVRNALIGIGAGGAGLAGGYYGTDYLSR